MKIDQTDEEISEMTKHMWKKHVKEMVKLAAFESLLKENIEKERQEIYNLKHLKFVNIWKRI